MASLLPALIIFDLDFNLMPFILDRDIAWPCKKIKEKVYDKWNDTINYFPEVPAVLEKIKNMSIKIAVISSRSKYIKEASDMINMLGWNKYISFQKIFLGRIKLPCLKDIQSKSNVPFDQILYFDAEERDVRTARTLGIFAVHVRWGMTMEVLDDALNEYEVKQREKKLEIK